MNKDEILAKSREEHQNSDVFEKEVTKEGESWSTLVTLFLAVVFFCVQIATGGGMNYGLYALIIANNTTICWVKYIKMKQNLGMAIAGTILTATLSAYHIYMLVVGA